MPNNSNLVGMIGARPGSGSGGALSNAGQMVMNGSMSK